MKKLENMKKEWLKQLRGRNEGVVAILPSDGEYVWLGGREVEEVLSLTVYTKDDLGWHIPIVHTLRNGDFWLQIVAKEGEGVSCNKTKMCCFLAKMA